MASTRPEGYDVPLPSDEGLEERRNALLSEKLDVEAEILKIRDQVERATKDFVVSGKRSDPDWFFRAKAALRHRGREAQEIQLELADIRDAIKARNTKQHAAQRSFMEVARRRLDPELFAEILEESGASVREREERRS